MKTITPLFDNILIEPQIDEKTEGGIYYPTKMVIGDHLKSKVIAVGKGAVNKEGKVRPMEVKAGDTVLHYKNGGTPAELNGKKYVILKEKDILGIFL